MLFISIHTPPQTGKYADAAAAAHSRMQAATYKFTLSKVLFNEEGLWGLNSNLNCVFFFSIIILFLKIFE